MKPGGVKKDRGKDPWDLLPWDAVRAVVQVLRHGTTKYAPRNWERGLTYGRCFAACQRHLTAWWDREEKDPESGLSHLAHACCCILFLLAFTLRRRERNAVDLDDRPAVR